MLLYVLIENDDDIIFITDDIKKVDGLMVEYYGLTQLLDNKGSRDIRDSGLEWEKTYKVYDEIIKLNLNYYTLNSIN